MGIEEFVKNKRVAIIGNADYDRNIDKDYDIIVRMNEPQYNINKVGRTDILCTSMNNDPKDFEKLNPKYIMWMSSLRERANEFMKSKIDLYYPLDMWEKLFNILGSRPSTGCMTIDYFSKISNNWDYFGFTFYGCIIIKPHNFSKEKEYICGLKK